MTTTNISTPIPHCGQCNSMGNLLLCSCCKVIYYCNRDHQSDHYPAHKVACRKIRKARISMEAEEELLRSAPADIDLPADPFTNAVGRFWGFVRTRPYMRARFALVEALQKVRTHASVRAQLEHMQDMMRLCRGDNLGVRYLIPALLLRLDRDQECYDFIKWHQTTGKNSDYDWGDMSLGFLDVKDADVFEGVGYLCVRFASLSFTVSIALLKIRLLLDLQNLTRCLEEHGDKVPNEVLDKILQQVVRSPSVSKNMELLERKDHSDLMEELRGQIKTLFNATDALNKHFWPALLAPGDHLTARPMSYSFGTVEEMQLTLQYTYDAWKESTGSIDMVRAIKWGNSF